jgi:hypothetical protein
MNSTISTDDYFNHHTFTNVEFTGVFERIKLQSVINETLYSIHIFIKYGNKVYMEDYRLGHIIISFDELQKNKYWKHFYDLSLMLTNNKHLVIEDIKYNSNFSYGPVGYPVYFGETRLWWIDTTIIDGNHIIDQEVERNIENKGHLCYYKINPYDLENMEYTTQEDLDTYLHTYMTRRCDIVYNRFDKKAMIFNDLAIDYNIRMIEKEIEELYEIFEDIKNVINLAVLNDKKDINYDVLMMIYNNIVSANGNRRYKHLMNDLGKSNRFESIAQILEA